MYGIWYVPPTRQAAMLAFLTDLLVAVLSLREAHGTRDCGFGDGYSEIRLRSSSRIYEPRPVPSEDIIICTVQAPKVRSGGMK
jgi:hypothetical protein